MREDTSQARRPEFVLIAFVGLAALLSVELTLTFLIPNTNYSSGDGWLAQSVLHATLKFGGFLHVTNINPLEGMGSQLLPLNVWANPAFWPFFFLEAPTALSISAVVALGCLAIACYVLMRCFDVPALPSIVAAQLVIVLFGPLALMFVFYQVFWINPGTATVYAAELVALGVLGRLQPGRLRDFILATGAIFVLLLYSLACDPLWAVIGGIAMYGAFALVVLHPLRRQFILLRAGALGGAAVLLIASGALGYVYTLSQYTSRVAFSDQIYYVGVPILASLLFNPNSSAGTVFYAFCGAGWVLGALLGSGRMRVLVLGGLASFCLLVIYAASFLQLPKWWLPVPILVEHAAFPLFIASAGTGYWAALWRVRLLAVSLLTRARAKAVSTQWLQRLMVLPPSFPATPRARLHLSPSARLGGLVIAVAVPVAAAIYGGDAGETAPDFYLPLPEEPQLLSHLSDTISLRVGGDFRGSVALLTGSYSYFDLWLSDIPTINEYDQLITPPPMYLAGALFNQAGLGTTAFNPSAGDSAHVDIFFKTLPALGVRYVMDYNENEFAKQHTYHSLAFPRRPAVNEWDKYRFAYLYEYPNPNVGNYSPTEIITATLGPDIVASMAAPEFDFTKQAVLPITIDEPLVAASDMYMAVIRGGWHVSGKSEGTSLVVLPQLFSHCLRASDSRVRLVRADLVLTGLIFSRSVDTDIVFDYGLFSPRCRRLDLADVKSLELKITH
jgi:hypothetical protein